MTCLPSGLVVLLTSPSFEHAFLQHVFLTDVHKWDMFRQFYSTLQNYLILMEPLYNAILVRRYLLELPKPAS